MPVRTARPSQQLGDDTAELNKPAAQTRFLKNLTFDCFIQVLAKVHLAAGQTPKTLERLSIPSYQEHAGPAEDCRHGHG